MAILASDILDHPCDDDDEKMETIYQIDFSKKGKHFINFNDNFCMLVSQKHFNLKGDKNVNIHNFTYERIDATSINFIISDRLVMLLYV